MWLISFLFGVLRVLRAIFYFLFVWGGGGGGGVGGDSGVDLFCFLFF